MTFAIGGCGCGEVRYELSEKPLFSYFCQCRDCQRATGTGHAALMMVDDSAVALAGQLRYFDVVSNSGATISRGFCAKCGYPVAYKISAYPNSRFIYASSLEDASAFRPSRVLWHCSALSWDVVDTSLKIMNKGV